MALKIQLIKISQGLEVIESLKCLCLFAVQCLCLQPIQNVLEVHFLKLLNCQLSTQIKYFAGLLYQKCTANILEGYLTAKFFLLFVFP